ncbi:MAG TPA: DUF5455 family protein [Rhodocyclaceae bacterium]|nr:DUF5455 family protein [Rhodocyclaceae bacterium]
MPILAGLLINLFGGLATFLAGYITKKLAAGVTAMTVFGALTLALYGALALLLNSIAATLPSWPGMEVAAWVAFPDNAPACVGAVISARVAIAVYWWNVRSLQFLADA